MAFERFLRRFDYVHRLVRDNARLLRKVQDRVCFFPPGHFYSAAPSAEEIAEAFARSGFGPPFPAVDLNESKQLALLPHFTAYYAEQPFPEEHTAGRRYYMSNPSYAHFDAIMLYCMLRHERPRRIIEVGSGFSSAAMLDLNELIFDGEVQLTFIDPDMSRLKVLLQPDDLERVALLERRVQEEPLETFSALEAGDVLFIDSSHVSKIGSDVNRLYFDVLPALQPGVRVHIHDVAANFEYPRDWLEEGRAWNEQYLLRAFLMYNRAFSIELFSAWLLTQNYEFFRTRMPLCAVGGGGQIWLRKTSV